MVEEGAKYEKIGRVTLDLSRYGGKDLYCDGAVEDTLLSIVREHTPEEYPDIIARERDWAVLYHLSELRENIIDWLRLPAGAKVLEVGAGCGAITGALARKAASVTCVELSKKRSLINAYRHRDAENITIRVGNFEDIEPALDTDYDYIFLIGVYEYAASYIHADDPYIAFLNILKKHRKEGGCIVIAIENRLGMKYFAGAREDHLGTYFSGIEGYPEGGAARTFSRPALERQFMACGLGEAEYYYPYPDYKFMTTLYSDRRLPREGELSTNLLNLDRERMLLFREKEAYDAILRDGLYPLYANSYLILLGGQSEVIYSKYSNDRAPEYAIRTDILRGTADGEDRPAAVEKYPMQPAAARHLASLKDAAARLSERYESSSELGVCPCEESKSGALRFPYLSGETLEEALDRALRKKDEKRLRELLTRYRRCADYHAEGSITDLDLIFSNILINEDGSWQLIDYEWTTKEALPVSEVVARALYVYLTGAPGREIGTALREEALRLSAADYDEARLAAREAEFQKKTTGKRVALGEMNALLGNPIWKLSGEMGAREAKRQRMEPQVYLDTGGGFSEAESYVPQLSEEDGEISLTVELTEGLRAVRYDPCRSSCLLRILSVEINGRPIRRWRTNGRRLSRESVLYHGEDPSLTIALRKESGSLTLRYRITEIDARIAAEVCG